MNNFSGINKLSAAWLKAVCTNDYYGRLSRSTSYIKQGKVSHISIANGMIKAIVNGSHPKGYHVLIKFKPWLNSRKILFKELMTENIEFINNYKNGYIDLDMIEATGGMEKNFFGADANVQSTRCSCQDYANPCKHTMATLVVAADIIKNNNPLILDLYGMESGVGLNEITLPKQEKYKLPSLSDLLETAFQSIESVDSYENILEDIENIPNLLEPLMTVLPDQPTFQPTKNFKKTYYNSLKIISEYAGRRVSDPYSSKTDFGSEYYPCLSLSNKNNIAFIRHKYGRDFMHLLVSSAKMPAKRLFKCSDEVQALYYAYKVSIGLLYKSAIIPQLYSAPYFRHQYMGSYNRYDYKKPNQNEEDGVLCLRWIPAMADTQVNHVMHQLGMLLPEKMLAFDGEYLTDIEAAVALCSAIIKEIMQEINLSFRAEPPARLFFKDFSNESEFTPNEIKQIDQWIANLNRWQDQYTPIFILEVPKNNSDEDNNFDKDNNEEEDYYDDDDYDFIFGSIGIIDNRSEENTSTPLASILKYKKYEKQREVILPLVNKMAEVYPPLKEYLGASGKNPILIELENIPELFDDILPMIYSLGVKVLLPKELQELYHPELSMKINTRDRKDFDSQGFLSLDQLLDFNWEVMIGNKSISAQEFEELIKSQKKLIRHNNQFIMLDYKKIEEIRRALDKPTKISKIDLLRAALSNEYENKKITLAASTKKLLKEFQKEKEIPLPNNLNAELRSYQLRGFNWLYRNIRLGVGSIIADDMGLGKTLQVITTLLKLKQDGLLNKEKALVVVPASLLINWQKEMQRFAPTLTFSVFHGSKRELNIANVDIVLTTYGIVRSAHDALKDINWLVIIIDEAQNIKNPTTAQTKSVKTLKGKHFIAMSGTPVENHLSEYWSIMDFANPSLLGGLTHFNKEFSNPIQNEGDEKVLERFKKITSPFLLRRLKSDKTIIQDLPDKIEQDQFCELSTQQMALYAATVRSAFDAIEKESETFERQGLILQMILALKKICNHPAHYLKDNKKDIKLSGKGQRFLELLEEIHESQQKVIIFTQYREMGEILQAWITQYFKLKCDFLHGGLDPKKRNVMVENFQNNPDQWAFILSLKAGGTGLNLTAATNVIHYDLWWNAAVEAQATDRAYRIGQKKNVQIHRLITKGTFEERINEIIQFKKQLSDITIGAGEKWIGNLSNKELKEIFVL